MSASTFSTVVMVMSHCLPQVFAIFTQNATVTANKMQVRNIIKRRSSKTDQTWPKSEYGVRVRGKSNQRFPSIAPSGRARRVTENGPSHRASLPAELWGPESTSAIILSFSAHVLILDAVVRRPEATSHGTVEH